MSAEAPAPRGLPWRSVGFALVVAVTLAVSWTSLRTLIHFSFEHEHEQYSHIVLIPLISAFLLGWERRRIFRRVRTAWLPGAAVLLAALALAWAGRRYGVHASENDRLSLATLPVVVAWIGGFLLWYGARAARAAAFPLLFLFLMVPIPEAVLNRVIVWLQIGSAEVVDAAFQVTGVPVFRNGLVFALPRFTIEIARECSGIRSSLALLVTSLLAGHLLLRSAWRKVVLILAAVPLLVVKNGIRIVSLTLLSMYVDPRFLTGNLHHRGGVVFFVIALVILAPVVWLLQEPERTEPLATR
jgi:exosortase